MSGIRILHLESHAWADERGWGVRPLEAAGRAGRAPGDLHVVSLAPGKVRGDHYHDGVEWLLITEGKVEVRSRSSGNEAVQLRILEGDRPVLLEIPSGVRHSFKNVGDRPVYLIAFSDKEKLTTTRAPLG